MSGRNPYQVERDPDLEVFAHGVIDEAMAKAAASPRDFGLFATQAAKQIASYVLARYGRKAP